MNRLLSILALLAAFQSPLFAVEAREFANETDANRYYELIAKLRCLVCQNQSLADSNAELARDMRDRTYELMFDKEASDSDIVDFMLARYGDFVLYKPPLNLATAALWFIPFVALLAGLILVARLAAASKSRAAEPTVAPDRLETARRLLDDASTPDRDTR